MITISVISTAYICMQMIVGEISSTYCGCRKKWHKAWEQSNITQLQMWCTASVSNGWFDQYSHIDSNFA